MRLEQKQAIIFTAVILCAAAGAGVFGFMVNEWTSTKTTTLEISFSQGFAIHNDTIIPHENVTGIAVGYIGCPQETIDIVRASPHEEFGIDDLEELGISFGVRVLNSETSITDRVLHWNFGNVYLALSWMTSFYLTLDTTSNINFVFPEADELLDRVSAGTARATHFNEAMIHGFNSISIDALVFLDGDVFLNITMNGQHRQITTG